MDLKEKINLKRKIYAYEGLADLKQISGGIKAHDLLYDLVQGEIIAKELLESDCPIFPYSPFPRCTRSPENDKESIYMKILHSRNYIRKMEFGTFKGQSPFYVITEKSRKEFLDF